MGSAVLLNPQQPLQRATTGTSRTLLTVCSSRPVPLLPWSEGALFSLFGFLPPRPTVSDLAEPNTWTRRLRLLLIYLLSLIETAGSLTFDLSRDGSFSTKLCACFSCAFSLHALSANCVVAILPSDGCGLYLPERPGTGPWRSTPPAFCRQPAQ